MVAAKIDEDCLVRKFVLAEVLRFGCWVLCPRGMNAGLCFAAGKVAEWAVAGGSNG